MTTTHESAGILVAKLAPPASVTVASIAGMAISEAVLWATLIYPVLMICHKLFSMYRDAAAWWNE